MTGEAILPLQMQVASLAVLLVFSGWVAWLIRTKRLQLRESLLWLLTTLAAIAATAFPELLGWAARAAGVKVPSNALFGAGLLYLAVNVLAITISVSRNTLHVRRLAQECAILRAEVEALRAGAAPAAGPPAEADRPAPPARARSTR